MVTRLEQRAQERPQITEVLRQRIHAIDAIAWRYGVADPSGNGKKVLEVGPFVAMVQPSRQFPSPPEFPVFSITEFTPGAVLSERGTFRDLPAAMEVTANFDGDVTAHVITDIINPESHEVPRATSFRRDTRKRLLRDQYHTAYGNPANTREFNDMSQDALLSWLEDAQIAFEAYAAQREQEGLEHQKAQAAEAERQLAVQETAHIYDSLTHIATTLQQRNAVSPLRTIVNVMQLTVPGERMGKKGKGFGNDTVIGVTTNDPAEIDICQYQDNARDVILTYNPTTGFLSFARLQGDTQTQDTNPDEVEEDVVEMRITTVNKPLTTYTAAERQQVLIFLTDLSSRLDQLPPPTPPTGETHVPRRGKRK